MPVRSDGRIDKEVNKLRHMMEETSAPDRRFAAYIAMKTLEWTIIQYTTRPIDIVDKRTAK